MNQINIILKMIYINILLQVPSDMNALFEKPTSAIKSMFGPLETLIWVIIGVIAMIGIGLVFNAYALDANPDKGKQLLIKWGIALGVSFLLLLVFKALFT